MTTLIPEATGTAVLSEDGRYRYLLSRIWDERLPRATFVMLNPSTADADTDDPTIRRCLRFAKSWRCGRFNVVNLYALRATDPRELWKVDKAQAVGPDNDYHLSTVVRRGLVTVAAWGANARPDRVAEILTLPDMDHLGCLGVTKDGAPRHPLYLPASAELRPWPVTP